MTLHCVSCRVRSLHLLYSSFGTLDNICTKFTPISQKWFYFRVHYTFYLHITLGRCNWLRCRGQFFWPTLYFNHLLAYSARQTHLSTTKSFYGPFCGTTWVSRHRNNQSLWIVICLQVQEVPLTFPLHPLADMSADNGSLYLNLRFKLES